MVSSVVKAQEVVFVKFKWQADKVVYVVDYKWEADRRIYITKLPWEVKENV